MAAGTGIGKTYTSYKERTTAPATPTATYDRLFFKADGLHYVNSSGVDVLVNTILNLDYQSSVLSIATATSAPPTETLGDRYIIGATGTPHANWDGAANNDIVQFNGTVWVATTPTEGMFTEVEDQNATYFFLSSWAIWQNQATATTSNVTFANVKMTTGAALGSLVKSAADGTLSYLADVVTGKVLVSGGIGADPVYSDSPTILSLTLADGGSFILPVTLTTDHTAVGEKVTTTAGENLVFGDNCYLKSDGKWWKADASASSTMPGTMMAVATIAANATGLFLKWGYARDDSAWVSMTVGADIYTSETAGGLTQTAPTPTSSATVILQRVGKAPSSNTASIGVIFYCPDPLTFEVGVDVIDVAATTGTELVDFTPTGWNEDASTWTMGATGPLDHVTGNTTTVTATLGAAIVAGTTYKVVMAGTGGGDTATYTLGGVAGTTIAASGAIAFTDYITATTTGSLIITPTSTCTVSMTSISVRACTKIAMSGLTASPTTWMANHTSDQTFCFAAPVAADVGKMFRIVKNGTGAGKLILDAPAGVTLNSAGASSADDGTAYLAASTYGNMIWMVTSATSLQLLHADGTVTFT